MLQSKGWQRVGHESATELNQLQWQPTPVFLPENPMNRGAWQATAHGVAKSQTQLSAAQSVETHQLTCRF